MKVQRVHMADTGRVTWMVLDDGYMPVQPIEEFLIYCENIERSPNTVRSYAHHLKLYWEYLNETNLDWTTANTLNTMADFVAWLRHPIPGTLFMQAQEAKRQESTVNIILSVVATFYGYHVQVGHVVENSLFRWQTFPQQRRYKSFLHHIAKKKPVQTRLIKLKQPKNLPKILTPAQVKQLVEACHRTRDKFLISLLYETGMRIGQALGLKHADIQIWNNTVRVAPRDDNLNGARAKQLDPYPIDVSTELMALYRDYVVVELEEVESEYVFVNLWQGEIGQPLKYETVIALFRRLSKKTGFYVHPHLFRHTHATELIRSGWDAAYVQKRLGHGHIQTTLDLYTHLDEEDLKQAYQAFQKQRKEPQPCPPWPK